MSSTEVTGWRERPDDGMASSTERRGGFDVIRLSGELDVSSTAGVRAVVDALVIDEARVHLVVDLTEVTFMDSSGLGALVRAQRRCRGLRGSFAVVCPDGPVLRVITLTGLLRVLRVFDTLDAATSEPPPA